MTNDELKNKFLEMLQNNQSNELFEKLYGDTVVSYEVDGNVYTGKEAVRAKNDDWYRTFEVLKFEIDGISNVSGDMFIVEYDMKIKNRETGEEMDGEEYGLYGIADGKIITERFFDKKRFIVLTQLNKKSRIGFFKLFLKN